MFDIAWDELLLIAVVALVVIGPKDLPRVLATVGRWVGRARRMAAEFQSGIERMAREAELEEMRREIDEANRRLEAMAAAREAPQSTVSEPGAPDPVSALAAPEASPAAPVPDLQDTALAKPDQPALVTKGLAPVSLAALEMAAIADKSPPPPTDPARSHPNEAKS